MSLKLQDLTALYWLIEQGYLSGAFDLLQDGRVVTRVGGRWQEVEASLAAWGKYFVS